MATIKSIEEKAKAYDGNYKVYTELINRLENVKEAIKKQNYGIAMDILFKPYPEFQVTTHFELKESEDELYIRELESLVKQVWATAEHKNDKDTIHKMSDLSFFLKTLKPQPQWKPSDEQMESLKLAIYGEAFRFDELQKLYDQLKAF